MIRHLLNQSPFENRLVEYDVIVPVALNFQQIVGLYHFALVFVIEMEYFCSVN